MIINSTATAAVINANVDADSERAQGSEWWAVQKRPGIERGFAIGI